MASVNPNPDPASALRKRQPALPDWAFSSKFEASMQGGHSIVVTPKVEIFCKGPRKNYIFDALQYPIQVETGHRSSTAVN